MRMKWLAVSLLLLLLLSVPVRAEDSPSITTWGKATIYVVPDRAIIAVAVHTVDTDFSKAVSENAINAEKLLTALKAMGIADKDIASGYVSINGAGWFGGFHVPSSDDKKIDIYRSYTITTTDLELIDKVLNTALKNGANQVDGVDLESSEMAKYRDQARQQAVRAARDKAILLAKELDAQVGKPKVIDETNANSYVPSGGISGSGAFIAGPEEPATPQTFVVGKIPVEAAVRVTFELK